MAFHVRRVAAVYLACMLGSTAFGQSNVLPVAELALPPASALGRFPSSTRTASVVSGAMSTAPKEDELAELSQEQPREGASWLAVELLGLFQQSSDLSDTGGEVALQRAGWKACLTGEAFGDAYFGLQLGAEASFYDFGGPTGLVPGTDDPFNDLYRTSLGASLFSQPTDGLGWFSGLDLTFAGEDDADYGESAIFAGVAGVRYAEDQRSVSLGLAVLEKLEGSPWIFPYLGLDLVLREGTRFTFEGSKVCLAQELGELWQLNLSSSYELRQYRLNPDGPLPSGVFRDDQIVVLLGLERHVPGGLGLELKVGGTVWQELEFRDDGGNPVGLSEVEPSALVQFGLTYGF